MRCYGFTSLTAMLALLTGCTGERVGTAPALPLALQTEAVPGGTRLLLIAPPGTRINAEVRPSLQLRDGRIVHFDTAAVTADSLYYAAPPAALLAAPPASAKGMLRASVCDDTARVCRFVKVEI